MFQQIRSLRSLCHGEILAYCVHPHKLLKRPSKLDGCGESVCQGAVRQTCSTLIEHHAHSDYRQKRAGRDRALALLPVPRRRGLNRPARSATSRASSLSATWLAASSLRSSSTPAPTRRSTRPKKSATFALPSTAAAPRVLAQEAARLDALLIHYSTDYVFDGEKSEPYLESDPISPVSVYGESKAAGEAAIAEAGAVIWCSAPAGFIAAHGKNFLRTMLRLGAERPELRVVDDQVGAPTSAAAIAAATARLVEYAPGGDGIYHMTAAGSTSWYGFARAIFSAGALAAQPRVQPIPSVGLSNSCQAACQLSTRQRQVRPHLRFSAARLAAATAIRYWPGCRLATEPTRLIDEVSSDHDCRCATP